MTVDLFSIKASFRLGADAARHDLIPGNPFRSAMPAAEQLGFEPGTPQYGAFLSGYMYGLPSDGVRVDADGRTLA